MPLRLDVRDVNETVTQTKMKTETGDYETETKTNETKTNIKTNAVKCTKEQQLGEPYKVIKMGTRMDVIKQVRKFSK